MKNKNIYNGKDNYEEWAAEWRQEDRYNFRTIESKWQNIWDEEKAYKVDWKDKKDRNKG